MPDPQGVYIARPDGYWWSGAYQAGTYTNGDDGGTSEPSTFPNTDAGALAIGAASYSVPAGAIFVAKNGNDNSGNGTQGSPYASLAQAISSASNNDTIVVRQGVYEEGGTTQNQSSTLGVRVEGGKSLTIQNYPGEAVWFDGSREATSWTQNGSTWSTAYNRVFDRSPTGSRGADDDTRPNWQWVNPSFPYAPWPDMAFIDGTPLEQVGSLGAVGPGKFFVEGANTGSGKWFAATTLHIGDNPSGKAVRVSDKVIFLSLNVENSSLRGIGVRRYANSNPDPGALALLRNGCELENVRIEDVSHDAATISGEPSGRTANNCTLRKVSLLRSGALGISCYMGDDFTLDRADIQYANISRYNYSPQAGAFKTTKSKDSTVKDSYFGHIFGKAYWCDQTIDSAICVNTMFEDIDDIAIKLECGSKAIIANNLFLDVNGNGVQVNNTDMVQIWNCTLKNCGRSGIHRPISWDQDGRQANDPTYSYNRDQRQPQSYYDQPENQWTIRNVTMHNTVITKPDSSVQGVFAIDDHTQSNSRLLSAYNPSTNGNLYEWVTKPQYPWIFPPSTQGGNATTYQTLAALQNGTGLESNSIALTSTTVIDSGNKVTNSVWHAAATPLPANVAAATGKTAGSKQIGVYI